MAILAASEAKGKKNLWCGKRSREKDATRTFLQAISCLENGFGALSVRNAEPDKCFEELLNSTMRSSGKKTRGGKSIPIFLAEVVLVITSFRAEWSFGRELLEEQTQLVKVCVLVPRCWVVPSSNGILVSWSLFPTSEIVLYSQDHLHWDQDKNFERLRSSQDKNHDQGRSRTRLMWIQH